jgi:cytoskeleton protein RodZ
MQREREMRGITLEEIAEATKIGTRSLRALEEQDFAKLPGGIFNKGFVRAYSRYLGIDEEQAVADYVNAVNESQAERAAAAANAEPEKTFVIADEQPQPLPQIAWKPILVLVVIAAAIIGGWRYIAKHGLPRLGRGKAAPTSAVQPPPAPTPSVPTAEMMLPNAGAAKTTSGPASKAAKQSNAGKTEAAAKSAAESAAKTTSKSPVTAGGQVVATPAALTEAKLFSVKVHATAESWVSITADGRLVMEGMLAADAEKTVRAERSVVLKTGNAGGVEVFHNEQAMPPLGEPNQVKTVTLTAEGMKNQ